MADGSWRYWSGGCHSSIGWARQGKASVGDAVSKLHKLLPESEWRALVSAHRSLPAWMAKKPSALGRIAPELALSSWARRRL